MNRLKKAKKSDDDEEAPKPKPKPSSSSAGGGDLFGDLLSALSRRRKGIGSRADKEDPEPAKKASRIKIPDLPEEKSDEEEEEGVWDP
jgi:hypothetical protein